MDLVQIVEALIFAAPESVTTKDIARAMRKTARETSAGTKEAAAAKGSELSETESEVLQKISAKKICGIIDEINETYKATGRPMHLVEGPGGWRFYTQPEYAPFIRSLLPDVKPERFSGPAMETLAIIAYRQPITKADIEVVRGVSVDGVLNKIIDRGLVRIVGRADLPGRPLLYETSETFLEHFGIKSIDDLPNSGELRRVELPSTESEDATGEGMETEEEQLSLGANSEENVVVDGTEDELGSDAGESEEELVKQEQE